MTFVASLTIPQLGCGAGYALWAFRAAAIGRFDCPALIRGFDRVFEDRSADARGALLNFARAIGSQGNRRIGLGQPGCCGVTSDELSIVAVLAAAQNRDNDRRDAHLLWLLGRRDVRIAATTANAVGAAFKSGGLMIDPPPIQLYEPQAAKPFTIIGSADSAETQGELVH